MLYHKTRDIVLIKEFPRCKTHNTKLLHVQIEKALFRNEPENLHFKATKDAKEIQALLKRSFDFEVVGTFELVNREFREGS